MLLALTLLAAGLVGSRVETDWNIRAWLTALIVLLGGLAQLLWLLLFSRLRWRIRLGVLGVVAAAALALGLATRVDGAFSGIGLPRLVWRWTPTADERFARSVSAGPAAVAAPATAAESRFRFSQFLGPDRDGRVSGIRLARDWQAQPPKELWRRPVGLGWSGFVVADGLAVTQEQRGEDEVVAAYTLTGGEPVWSHTNRVRFREWQGGDGPRATPTVDGRRVYAYGATGILDCLDLADGRRVWSVDVLATNGLDNLTWGKSCSPLLAGGRVIVTGGTASGLGAVALDADTGAMVWADNGDAATYSSPSSVTLAGRSQILVTGARATAGLDPATGNRLWEFAWGDERWPKCSQPVVVGTSRVFLSAGYSVGCRLIELAAGPDGALVATEVWRGRTLKTQFNNVAVRDGHLFGLDDGLLACVELATGARRWKDGRYGSGQTLLVDDLVLIQAEPGFIALAEARPDGFAELARLPALSAKTWNNPALAGPYLLVRNDREAACYLMPLAGG